MHVPPVDPPPSPWGFPDPRGRDEHDIVCVGADLAPGTLLAAYRAGLFPMPIGRRRRQVVIGWFSPGERGIVPLDGLRVSRSLRQSCRRFEIRVDTCFGEVMRACADPRRPHGWIDDGIVDAYTRLHELGWAHSVEVWRDGRLEGGLYGVAIGGLFAGESMFHRATDASKVALVALVERLRAGGFGLLDVQWLTPHLATLGAIAVPQDEYLARLAAALPLDAHWPHEAPTGRRDDAGS